jgi:hypothetical protein
MRAAEDAHNVAVSVPERAPPNPALEVSQNAGSGAFATAAGPLRATAGENRHARGGLKNSDGGETRFGL